MINKVDAYECIVCKDAVVLGTEEHLCASDEWCWGFVDIKKTCQSCKACQREEETLLS